jgi:quinoprotein glucose dehydrogenase
LGNAQSRFCGAAVEKGRDIATMGRRRCGAIALVVGLSSTYHEIDGTIVAATSQPRSFRPVAQPDEDRRAYWRTQFGQRYSPLRQITPANVSNLKVARTFRTGDLPGPNDPGETPSKVTPIKVRNSLYHCPPHQRLFALDAKTEHLPWSFDPKVRDNPTFQHLTCRGVSYHETTAGAPDSSVAPAATDRPHKIFLPVNDGRMIHRRICFR